MISFTRMETREINEEDLFENVMDYLFEQETFNGAYDYVDIVENLPKEVQRLILTKMSIMMLEYAKSEDF